MPRLPVVVLLAAGFTFGVTPSASQDCGELCGSCGLYRYEGFAYHPWFGWYDMRCNVFSTFCNPCPFVPSVHVPATSIASAFLSATPTDRALVVANMERLVILPRRGLLLIQGDGCDPGQPQVLVRIPDHRDLMGWLRLIGVRVDAFPMSVGVEAPSAREAV